MDVLTLSDPSLRSQKLAWVKHFGRSLSPPCSMLLFRAFNARRRKGHRSVQGSDGGLY